jgi:hypothetical protein
MAISFGDRSNISPPSSSIRISETSRGPFHHHHFFIFFFLSSIFRSSVSFFDSQRVWTSAVCSPNFVGRSFLKEKKRLPDAMNPDPLLYIS